MLFDVKTYDIVAFTGFLMTLSAQIWPKIKYLIIYRTSKRSRSVVRSIIRAFRARHPGSNPGGSTILLSSHSFSEINSANFGEIEIWPTNPFIFLDSMKSTLPTLLFLDLIMQEDNRPRMRCSQASCLSNLISEPSGRQASSQGWEMPCSRALNDRFCFRAI